VSVEIRFGFRRFHFQALLAEARLRNGEVKEAEQLASSAVDLCRRHGQRGWTADALRIQGEILEHPALGRLDEALACYREALTLAGELGMHPLVAHCHLGLGKLYRRTGDRAKADEHLASATAMYREMDMAFWLERGGGAGADPLSASPAPMSSPSPDPGGMTPAGLTAERSPNAYDGG
jgi:tetratricopeptide (TPR) repeat protein